MDASYEFLRAARALLGMENVDLAAKAGVSKRSLVRIEAGETVRPEIRRRVQAVFEEAGIVFVPEDSTSGPGLRVRNDLPESAARDSDRSDARRSLGEAKIIQASDIPATR